MGLDLRLLDWIAEHRSPGLTHVATTLMDGGSSPAVLGITLAVVFVIGLAVGQIGAVWIAVAAGGSASAIATALKSLADRPRPPAELALVAPAGSSMPSTVAALTAGIAVALVCAPHWPATWARRAAATVLALVVLLVGAAMVYLGAHWASDVLVGWLLGGLLGGGLGLGYRRLRAA